MSGKRARAAPAVLPDPELARRLRAEYRRECGFQLLVCRADGRIESGSLQCPAVACGRDECAAARERAIGEALRWGEPCVNFCHHGLLVWAMPVMDNNEVRGGLVVAGVPVERAPSCGEPPTAKEIRAACDCLTRLAVRHNLVNAELLELRRGASERERLRAEAIHDLKDDLHDSIRAIYLREEPFLLAAIRRGDRGAAREVLNRVLVAIYHVGARRLDLLKSFLLELVVMMSRAAVEAGGNPNELLGINYDSLAALSRIDDDVELSHWLTECLERLLDGIRDSHDFPNTVLLANAVRYMEEHLGEEISRSEVARAAGLSEGHFSRLIREKTGRTYVDLLAQHRVDRACELLRRTDKGVLQIALECGFSSQSYFTRVFRRYKGETPRAYVQRHAGSGPRS